MAEDEFRRSRDGKYGSSTTPENTVTAIDDRAQRLVRMIRDLPVEKASPIMKLLKDHEAEVATINRWRRRVTAVLAFLLGCGFTKFVEWLAHQ